MSLPKVSEEVIKYLKDSILDSYISSIDNNESNHFRDALFNKSLADYLDFAINRGYISDYLHYPVMLSGEFELGYNIDKEDSGDIRHRLCVNVKEMLRDRKIDELLKQNICYGKL